MSYIYGGIIATAGFIDMAEAETSSSELVLPINQLHDFSFPKCQFDKFKIVSRSFQSQWFYKWKWLHYDAASDAALCYIFMNAVHKNKMPSSGNADQAFISRGYSNWKDATGEKGVGLLITSIVLAIN